MQLVYTDKIKKKAKMNKKILTYWISMPSTSTI